jgi:hypothetical protein
VPKTTPLSAGVGIRAGAFLLEKRRNAPQPLSPINFSNHGYRKLALGAVRPAYENKGVTIATFAKDGR